MLPSFPTFRRLSEAFQGAVTSLDSQPQGAALGWQVLPRWGFFPVTFVPAGTLPLWGGLGWGFPLPLWGGPGWGSPKKRRPSFSAGAVVTKYLIDYDTI